MNSLLRNTVLISELRHWNTRRITSLDFLVSLGLGWCFTRLRSGRQRPTIIENFQNVLSSAGNNEGKRKFLKLGSLEE
jgi:hypothetical protein